MRSWSLPRRGSAGYHLSSNLLIWFPKFPIGNLAWSAITTVWQVLSHLRGKVLKSKLLKVGMPQPEYLGAFPGDVKGICLKSCAIEVDCWFGIRSLELRQCQSTKLFLNGECNAFAVQVNLIQSLWEESKTIITVKPEIKFSTDPASTVSAEDTGFEGCYAIWRQNN